MSELPHGWTIARLDEVIGDIEAGKNILCIERPPEGSERGIVKISAVSWGQFDEAESKTIPPGAEIDERARISPGDLLISRANTIELIGACVRVGTIRRTLYLSDKVLRLRAPALLLPWLHRYLSSPNARRAISTASSGNQLSMRNISQVALKALAVPVAPQIEQRRIGEKLDAILSRIDTCRARLNRVPQILKKFRKAVLEAAVSGRLTEKWRQEASMTLSSWQELPFGKYVDNHDGRREPIAENLRAKRRGSYPYYGASGIIDSIDAYTHDGRYLLIGEDGANLLTRSKPIAFVAEGKIWVNNHAHVVSCRDLAPVDYLCYFINSIDLRPYVTGSAQPKLTQAKLNGILIPVPPIAEQAEIVRRVREFFIFADSLERRYAAAIARVQKLTPSVLAKAFCGELVPQDPNDEPAREMLERLSRDSKEARRPTRMSHAHG